MSLLLGYDDVSWEDPFALLFLIPLESYDSLEINYLQIKHAIETYPEIGLGFTFLSRGNLYDQIMLTSKILNRYYGVNPWFNKSVLLTKLKNIKFALRLIDDLENALNIGFEPVTERLCEVRSEVLSDERVIICGGGYITIPLTFPGYRVQQSSTERICIAQNTATDLSCKRNISELEQIIQYMDGYLSPFQLDYGDRGIVCIGIDAETDCIRFKIAKETESFTERLFLVDSVASDIFERVIDWIGGRIDVNAWGFCSDFDRLCFYIPEISIYSEKKVWIEGYPYNEIVLTFPSYDIHPVERECLISGYPYDERIILSQGPTFISERQISMGITVGSDRLCILENSTRISIRFCFSESCHFSERICLLDAIAITEVSERACAFECVWATERLFTAASCCVSERYCIADITPISSERFCIALCDMDTFGSERFCITISEE